MRQFFRLATALLLVSIPVLGAPVMALGQDVRDLPAGDRDLEATYTDAYRIGGMNAPEWALFGRIASVGFDGNGAIYIHDLQNNRIVVVGENGQYLRDVAEQGGGPGEFGMPMAMVVAPDGALSVFDAGHMGFLQFAADGAYIDQTPHSFEEGLPSFGGVAHDPSGGVLFSSSGAVAIRRGPGGETRSGGGEGRPIRRVLDDGRNGVVYDAWQLPAGESRMENMSGGGMQISAQMPVLRAFEPGLYFGTLSSGDIVLSDTIDYSVKVMSSSGEVRSVLRRPIEPREVGRRERAAEKERQLAELEDRPSGGVRIIVRGGGGGSGGQTMGGDAVRDMMTRRIEGMEFAEQIPVIAGMRVDSWQDHVWLQRSGRSIGEGGPVDVITGSGEYLGTLAEGTEVPRAFGPGGLVAYVEMDELDVPTVVVKRIQLGR